MNHELVMQIAEDIWRVVLEEMQSDKSYHHDACQFQPREVCEIGERIGETLTASLAKHGIVEEKK